MNPVWAIASTELISAALNGVGLGILLAVLFAFGLRLLGPTNAATRHAIWFAALLLIAAIVPIEWAWDIWVGEMAIGAESESGSAREEVRTPAAGGALRPQSEGALMEAMAQAQSEPATAEEVSAHGAATTTAGDVPLLRHDLADPLPPQPVSRAPWRRVLGQVPVWWRVPLNSKAVQATGLLLMIGWAGGASLRLSLLLRHLLQIRKLKRQSLPPSTDLAGAFERCRSALGITRQVALRISTSPALPMVLGFRNPVVLLPGEESLEPAQSEPILAHELAHVQRWDDWANLVHHLIQAILFFHPVVGWIGKRLSLEREIASDDFVLHQGGEPRFYARLLVSLASRLTSPPTRLAPGVSIHKSQLKQRIVMILNTQRSTSPRPAKARVGFLTAGAVLAALLALYAGPRLVLAQSGPATNPPQDALAPATNPAPPPAPPREFADTQDSHQSFNIDSGPKPKPNLNVNLDDAASPSPAPPAEPRPPRPPEPRHRRGPDSADRVQSLEERLDRLERLVKMLVADQNIKSPRERRTLDLTDGKQMAEANAFADLRASKREIARAADEAKRAAKEAQKKVEAAKDQGDNAAWPDPLRFQMDVLQKQRDALQRETDKLERQIEHIRQQQQRLKERQQRHGPSDDKDSKPDDSGTSSQSDR
jgi:beta-lactamase regulating signal transducer with metallopeptidase domain